MDRTFAIVVSVVLLHIAALWALQQGLLQRTVEMLVPAQILSEFVSPPSGGCQCAPDSARKSHSLEFK